MINIMEESAWFGPIWYYNILIKVTTTAITCMAQKIVIVPRIYVSS